VSGRVKPIGNWLCRVVEATASASIQWIWLCIRIIVSWVVVFWLRVFTCLVDVRIFVYKIVWNSMINRLSTRAYPLCLFVWFVCGFLFLRWSSIYWWEQMRELFIIIRVIKILLLSSSRVGSSYFRVFLLGLWPIFYLLFEHLFRIMSNYSSVLLLASWCALVFYF